MLERCLPIETEQQGPTYPQGPNPQRLIKGTNQQGGVIHRMKYIKNIKKRGLYHHFFFPPGTYYFKCGIIIVLWVKRNAVLVIWGMLGVLGMRCLLGEAVVSQGHLLLKFVRHSKCISFPVSSLSRS